MRGSIYQRESDKRWVGSVSLGKDKNGKRKRKTVYGETKREVEEKINKILFEIQTGEYAESNKSTLIEYLNDYYSVCSDKWEGTTSSLYRMYIDVHFAPYFKDMKLIDVKPIVLDTFYNYKLNQSREYFITEKGKRVKRIAEPLSVNTVRKLNTFLKAAFNYAIINDLIKNNPTNNVKLGKKEKYLPVVYNEDQFMQLLDYVSGTDDEIPITLGGGCGLRRGEIFGLYWRNIDFENGYITIENTTVRFDETLEKKPKNVSSVRKFKAPSYVMDMLSNYMISKGGYKKVRYEKVITRWKPGSYSDRFSKLLDKFDMPHIRLHDLRHYNAVIMCKYGISDKVAAERLGHSQVSTLRNVYQHVLEDMDQTAANEIDLMFSKQKEREDKKSNFKVV